MSSWITISDDSDFSLRNLPYGVFSTSKLTQRIGVAIGDFILDLKTLAQDGVFSSLQFNSATLEAPVLNPYAGLGRDVHRKFREYLTELLKADTSLGSVLRDNDERKGKALVPVKDVRMHLPMVIGDYTDFFVGEYHAQNCSNIFAPGKSLPPNYRSLPVGYHGRASSVVVSGTPFRRPRGQFPDTGGKVVFSPSEKLDFECEFAAFIAQGNEMGASIATDEAESHIFGVVMMNDWSARDIQFWEATPLGPFNGKNFCTTISPWIVPLDALEPFRVELLHPRKQVSYLEESNKKSVFNISVDVALTADGTRHRLFRCNTRNTIFSFAQMIAHHTANGCPLRTGDLLATGTLTGPEPDGYGCLFEASLYGKRTLEFEAADGGSGKVARTFLEDGDEIDFHACADDGSGEGRVGFGQCTGKVLANP